MDISVDNFFHSAQKIEKNSVFQGHTIGVHSILGASSARIKLYQKSDIAVATHNIYAYRIGEEDGLTIEGFSDDGEYGASKHLISFLREQHLTNIMIIVSRWLGGSMLGKNVLS